MLYAQNGATDAKLRCDEHRQKVRVSGQKSTETIPDPDPARGYCSSGAVPEDGRIRCRRRRDLPEKRFAGPARRLEAADEGDGEAAGSERRGAAPAGGARSGR